MLICIVGGYHYRGYKYEPLGPVQEDKICKAMISEKSDYQEIEVTALSEALLYCKHCKNLWSSHNVVIDVDLNCQVVKRRYRQMCKTCDKWAVPLFTEDRFIDILEQAVEKGDQGDTSKPSCSNGSHMVDLCEWCKKTKTV